MDKKEENNMTDLENCIEVLKKIIEDYESFETPECVEPLQYALSLAEKVRDGKLVEPASVDEINRLHQFVEFILRNFSWEGCDVDGGEAQDKAVELGLIELRPIKEEDSIDGEKEHYFVRW